MTYDPEERRQMWDARYGEKGFVFGVDANQFVAASLADLPPGRALDLASGQGRNAVWLAARGHDVTAIDLSPVAIAQAQRLAEEAGVDVAFFAADLLTWEPEPEAFDLVVLSYLHLPEAARTAIHAKAIRALAPGGVVFVIAHHHDNLEHGIGGPPSSDVLFTEADLAADFADLEIERLERVLRRVETDEVSGDAIDVLLFARKAA